MAKYADGNVIRHDLREQKQSLMGAVVCSIIGIAGFFIFNTDIVDCFSSVALALFGITATMIFPAAALVLWIYWFDCFCYLKRLRRHGYKIPENKKRVSGGLAGLTMEADTTADGNPIKESPGMKIRNKGSMVLSGICLIAVIIVLISAVRMYLQYHLYLGAGPMNFLLVIHAFILLGWAGYSFYFGRQSDNSKYKDDVELDVHRKNRKNIVEGILIILFLSAISAFIIYDLYNMADYISYEARLMAERKG